MSAELTQSGETEKICHLEKDWVRRGKTICSPFFSQLEKAISVQNKEKEKKNLLASENKRGGLGTTCVSYLIFRIRTDCGPLAFLYQVCCETKVINTIAHGIEIASKLQMITFTAIEIRN